MLIREQIVIYDKKQLNYVKVMTQHRIRIQGGILSLSFSKLKIDLQTLRRVKYILSFIFFSLPLELHNGKIKKQQNDRAYK